MKYFGRELRQAKPTDITQGKAVVIDGDESLVEMKIDEVLNPSDEFKAFYADDGCRYGIDGCFVFKDED